jgi:hypothetical protein
VKPLFYLKTETDPVSEMFFPQETDDGQSPKTGFFQVQYTIVRTL